MMFTIAQLVTSAATMPEPQIPWARIILAFFFCIGVAVAAIAFLRWRSGEVPLSALLRRVETDKERAFEIVERTRVGPGAQLCMLACRERRYLIYIGPNDAVLLDRFTQEDPAEDEA